MKLFRTIMISLTQLRYQKRRVALTISGMVIGVASVMVMVSVVQAAQTLLLSQVASFGSDVIFVANGRGDQLMRAGPDPILKQTLTYRDYLYLKERPWMKATLANLISTDVLSFGGAGFHTQVVGSTPDELVIFPESMAQGRYLLDEDVQFHASVIVLGSKVVERLFGNASVIGERVRVGQKSFRVIGILRPGGTRFFTDINDLAYIPVTTALDLYHKDRLQFISLKPYDLSARLAKERVRIALRETHKIDNPKGNLSKDDFRVMSQEDAERNTGIIADILRIFLVSAASISLLVGGIGIMNMMYVRVTERTQEIGLRKAVGATEQDILRQFLFEAIFLSTFGGLIGIVAGLLLSWGLISLLGSFQTGWIFIWPRFGTVIAFIVSVGIGILFGFIPARSAAKKQPLVALQFDM